MLFREIAVVDLESLSFLANTLHSVGKMQSFFFKKKTSIKASGFKTLKIRTRAGKQNFMKRD